MHDAGVMPSLMTYNTLISGCVRADAPAEALLVFNLMKEKRIKRDQVRHQSTSFGSCEMHLGCFVMTHAWTASDLLYS